MDEPAVDFEAAYAASLALAAQGRFAEAGEQARLAQSFRPDDWRGHAHVGSLALIAGDAESALANLARAARCAPDRPEVLNNMGAALRALGRHAEAEAHFARAVALAPGYDHALKNLTSLLNAAGRHAEAFTHLRAAFAQRGVTAVELAENPPSPELYEELGKSYWGCGDLPEAAACFRYSASVDPDADSYEQLGAVFVQMGRAAEARSALLDALACAPDRADLYLRLAEVDPGALTDAHLESLRNFIGAHDDGILVNVHFALARALDRRGRTQEAFAHFAAANAHARGLHPYDEAETLGNIHDMQAAFSPEFLARHAGNGHRTGVPVFIFGMPRSGTTLVEQILAMHPSVEGGGELPIVNDLARKYRGDQTDFADLGAHYAARIRARFPDALRVTDKMPANYRYAGLIHLALPDAKLVHVVRDPLDTCFSCFAEYLPAAGLAWTCDVEDIGRYYRAYADLMEHWRSALPPGVLLEVRYEDLVGDLETHARRIITHCGLPWDDRCLKYYENERGVRTASALQVRRPVYRTSVGRSRRYLEHLQPLIDALGQRVAPA